MDDTRSLKARRVRFYTSLETMLVAWSVMALALGAALGLNTALHYVFCMTGLLVILGLALRSRTYREVKPLHP